MTRRGTALPRVTQRLRRAATGGTRTRQVVLAATVIGLLAAPVAIGQTATSALDGGARNPSNNTSSGYGKETEIVGSIAQNQGGVAAGTGGYTTRQSNKSDSGGGAIYGCRSKAGGSTATPKPQNPCLRSNNLETGYAFEFQATNGDSAGLITVGGGGDSKKPFTTNATGVATGLNADRVDGLDASQIVSAASAPIAQVAADGTAGQTRGVVSGGVTNPAGDGTYQVVFTGDLTKCALSATATGTAASQVTVTPALASGNTAVDVRTFDGAGAAADRGFHLSANC
jgi:hypothetical protein